MKLNWAIPGLLIALLVGCNVTNQDNTVQSPQEIKQISEVKVVEVVATPTPSKISQSTNTSVNFLTYISNSAYSNGKAAKLTPKQVKDLIQMENRRKKLRLENVKAIVPTYVPPGFTVEKFKITIESSNYYIAYRNSSNTSFLISSRWSDCHSYGYKPRNFKVMRISSIRFDNVTMRHIGFDSSRAERQILGEISSVCLKSDKNSLNLQQAKKIIESMDYLNNAN
jgi:hypothetical protein